MGFIAKLSGPLGVWTVTEPLNPCHCLWANVNANKAKKTCRCLFWGQMQQIDLQPTAKGKGPENSFFVAILSLPASWIVGTLPSV